MKRTKIASIVLCLALLCGMFILTSAGADDGNLSVTASISGKNMDITLWNKTQNYLGNVKVSIKTPDGTVLNLSADGTLVKASGVAADTLRSLAPSTTKKFSSSLGQYAPVTVTTKKPVTTTKTTTTTTTKVTTPKVTTTEKTTTTTGTTKTTTTTRTDAPVVVPDNTQAQTDAPVPVIPSEVITTDTSIETAEDTIRTLGPDETVTISTEISTDESDTEDTTLSGTDTDETESDDTSSDDTSAGATEGVATDGEDGDGDGGYAVGIIIAVVAGVLVIGAAVVLIVLKKKRSVSSVIVIAVLLSGLGAAGGYDAQAAASTSTVTETVSTDSGAFTVTVTYKLVPAAVTNPLKSTRRPPSGDECNTPQVDERRLVEGAGPLTGSGIYIGSNDMMFNGDELDMYRGETADITGTRLNKLSKMMNDRDAWAKENGIKLYFVICPNKCTVYSDYVPDKVRAADTTLTDKVVNHLAANSTVEVIDLRDTLIDARATYGDDLYYNYDTHWNNNGGFAGYTEIMRRISEDIPGTFTLQKSDFEITEYETYMKDLTFYLGYYSTYKDYGPVYTLKSGMTATIGDNYNDGYWGQFKYCSKWKDGYTDALKYVEYDNEYNDGAPNLYMYRDSYSLALIHFLKDSFDESVFDWSFEFNKAEIKQSGADVVIIECVERSIPEIIDSRTFSS